MTSTAITIDGPFWVGDEATLLIQWSDPLQPGTPGDPTTDPNTGYKLILPSTVTCTLRSPSGVESLQVVIPPAAGSYVYRAVTAAFSVPGPWWFGWDASGNYVAHKEGLITVRRRNV